MSELQKTNLHLFPNSPKGCSSFASVIMCIIFLGLVSSQAYGRELRYDENTEVKVKGKVVDCKKSNTYLGFNCFLLKTKNRVYRVLTAPCWYKHQSNIKKIKKNTPVVVIGSKFFGRDGSLCLLAKSIKLLPSGPRFVFWDKENNPIWGSYRRAKSSCMRIFFQPH